MEQAASSGGWAEGALAAIGLQVDEGELAIINAVQAVYGARLQALMDLDLSSVDPEPGADLSRAPAGGR